MLCHEREKREGRSRFGPFPLANQDGSLLAGGVSPLSLLTFFAAAKKVSAAPHRGNANRPLTTQEKAKDKKQKNKAPRARIDPQGINNQAETTNA